ncbi:MAG: leucyl aminopeptidase, partial [Micrococcales bacterium]|nr:leucyl aminopeptidase [Micrococcales bacterium]
MIALTSKNPTDLPVDALVVATAMPDKTAAQDKEVTLLDAEWLPTALRAALLRDAAALGLTGAADEVRRVPATGLKAKVLVLTGVGAGPVTTERLRRAAGAATRELAGVGSVALALPAADVASAVAVAEGALLGAYTYARYRATGVPAPVASIEVVTPKAKDATAALGVTRAEVLAAAVHAARDLVNAAPNHLFPEAFAEAARAAAKGVKGVKVTVLDEKALAASGYGGLVGVGQGSTRPPRLVKVAYSPARTKAKVALVGKGITFDSGGISIKPSSAMETMKSDMAGAAAVLQTVL